MESDPSLVKVWITNAGGGAAACQLTAVYTICFKYRLGLRV